MLAPNQGQWQWQLLQEAAAPGQKLLLEQEVVLQPWEIHLEQNGMQD